MRETDRAALLRAVLDDPKDDHVRRVYADWLEEYGDENDRLRAEFIRAQLDLEFWPRDPRRVCTCDWAGHRAVTCGSCRRRQALVARSLELLRDHNHLWLPAPAGFQTRAIGTMTAVVYWYVGETVCSAVVRRGFLEELRCPLRVWLAHGPLLARTHPVTRLYLHDRAPVSVRHRSGGSRRFAWFVREAYGESSQDQPHVLPAALLPPGRRRVNHRTSQAATDWLIATCLKWARAQKPQEVNP